MVHHFKPWLRWIPVHASDVTEIIEGTVGIFSQDGAGVANEVPLNPYCQLIAVKLGLGDGVLLPAEQLCERGMRFQLLEVGDGRRREPLNFTSPHGTWFQSSTPFFHT